MSSHFNWIYNAVTHLVKYIVMFNYVNTIYDAEIRISIVLNIHHFFVMRLCKLLLLAALKYSNCGCFLWPKKYGGFFVIAKEEDQCESHGFKISHDFWVPPNLVRLRHSYNQIQYSREEVLESSKKRMIIIKCTGPHECCLPHGGQETKGGMDYEGTSMPW